MISMTPERIDKIQRAAARTQNDLTVILENVHDPHNIGAVLRTCESVGIREVFVIYNQPGRNAEQQYVGVNSASGSKKWVKVHFYEEVEKCLTDVRKSYTNIYGTYLNTQSVSLYDLDLNASAALVFGNEKEGISDELFSKLDGNFIIPQYGLVQSLNISVACAVTLFEASRQRMLAGKYSEEFNPDNERHTRNFKMLAEAHLHASTLASK